MPLRSATSYFQYSPVELSPSVSPSRMARQPASVPARGTLRPGTPNAALLRATFPPGSVTGAPKVQSLRVIAELERTAREVYTGAIGYCSPIAGLELNVAIRTLELRDGRLWIGAGGGIVADSDPHAELAEAIAKARPIAAAVGADVRVGGSDLAVRGRRHSIVAA